MSLSFPLAVLTSFNLHYHLFIIGHSSCNNWQLPISSQNISHFPKFQNTHRFIDLMFQLIQVCRWRAMMNLCPKGHLYVIPTLENTFLGNPRSHKYSWDVISVLDNGSTGYKHHFGVISTVSIGGSMVKTGALLWATHLTWDWYQIWSFRKEFSWLSKQFTIISTEHVGISLGLL